MVPAYVILFCLTGWEGEAGNRVLFVLLAESARVSRGGSAYGTRLRASSPQLNPSELCCVVYFTLGEPLSNKLQLSQSSAY
jgi:hypothetical protein